jgi:hypothetical protein
MVTYLAQDTVLVISLKMLMVFPLTATVAGIQQMECLE